MNLQVVSAIFWLESDRVDTIDLLLDSFLKDSGKVVFSDKINSIIDTRTHAWYSIPINSFVGTLVQERLKLKAKPDSISQATQDSMKLVINTLWGIFTSVFFSVGNVAVSEFVTTSVRTAVWMISKGLNTRLSITDGGAYSLMEVSYIKSSNRLPSLNSLSTYKGIDLDEYLKACSEEKSNNLVLKEKFYFGYSLHRSIQIKPLENINWNELFENNIPYTQSPFNKLDVLAQNHIIKFWANYQIDFEQFFGFQVEHKIVNTFISASYMLKAHYAFKIWNDNTSTYSKIEYKIRGFGKDDEITEINPMYSLLIFLLDNSIEKPFIIENNGPLSTKKVN